MPKLSLTQSDIKFIEQNCNFISIPDMCKEIDVHYDVVYKHIKSNELTMIRHPLSRNVKHKHNFTKRYQAQLFNAIKRLERELTTGSTDAERELIKNMKVEYNAAIMSTKSATDKLRYTHLGGSMLHLWKPKLNICTTQHHTTQPH